MNRNYCCNELDCCCHLLDMYCRFIESDCNCCYMHHNRHFDCNCCRMEFDCNCLACGWDRTNACATTGEQKKTGVRPRKKPSQEKRSRQTDRLRRKKQTKQTERVRHTHGSKGKLDREKSNKLLECFNKDQERQKDKERKIKRERQS